MNCCSMCPKYWSSSTASALRHISRSGPPCNGGNCAGGSRIASASRINAMARPLISVILPVFNAEDFVTDAIRSVLQQTCRDFELLVVDDGSTDGTREIISRFATSDDRVKVLVNEKNQGLVSSLNRGLDYA